MFEQYAEVVHAMICNGAGNSVIIVGWMQLDVSLKECFYCLNALLCACMF